MQSMYVYNLDIKQEEIPVRCLLNVSNPWQLSPFPENQKVEYYEALNPY